MIKQRLSWMTPQVIVLGPVSSLTLVKCPVGNKRGYTDDTGHFYPKYGKGGDIHSGDQTGLNDCSL